MPTEKPLQPQMDEMPTDREAAAPAKRPQPLGSRTRRALPARTQLFSPPPAASKTRGRVVRPTVESHEPVVDPPKPGPLLVQTAQCQVPKGMKPPPHSSSAASSTRCGGVQTTADLQQSPTSRSSTLRAPRAMAQMSSSPYVASSTRSRMVHAGAVLQRPSL